jgi:regulator of protease activity HflC (stomatin/prohibitin superfamily)
MVFLPSCFHPLLVETGHRAIKYNKVVGVRETVLREGFHLKIPFIERPIIYDVKANPTIIKSMTGSKGKEYCLIKEFRFAND